MDLVTLVIVIILSVCFGGYLRDIIENRRR